MLLNGFQQTRRYVTNASVLARLILSAIAILGILTILYRYIWLTSSISAVIAGDLIDIVAPIPGRIDFLHIPADQTLAANQIFATIVNDRQDDRSLQEFIALRARSRNVIAALDQELIALSGLKERFEQRAETSHQAERQRLQLLQRQAQVALPGAKAQLDLNQAEQDRVSILVDEGNYHPVRLFDAKKNSARAASELERLETIVDQTKGQLAALDKGSVIGEGFDDAPYSQQRLDDVLLHIADITTAREQAKADLEEADSRFEAEEMRLERSSKALISTSFHARIWTRQTGSGVELREASPIVGVIDCDHLFVVATLPERLFDRIKPGDTVQIRASGADHNLTGNVRAIRGQGSPTSLNNVVSLERSSEKIMTIDINFSAASTADLADCPVGRSVSVVFK